MSETTVRERPILFSGEMVRAILGGRKTQTRRVAAKIRGETGTLNPAYLDMHCDPARAGREAQANRDAAAKMWCPYGQPGDRLWVRETFSTHVRVTDPHYLAPDYHDSAMGAWYWADGNPDHGDWTKPKPSIHMPRWASRLTLELTEVRVERVQAISEDDARAEGFADTERDLPELNREIGGGFRMVGWHESISASGNFALTWDRLNAKRGYDWDANPWVWVVSFRATPPSAEQSTP